MYIRHRLPNFIHTTVFYKVAVRQASARRSLQITRDFITRRRAFRAIPSRLQENRSETTPDPLQHSLSSRRVRPTNVLPLLTSPLKQPSDPPPSPRSHAWTAKDTAPAPTAAQTRRCRGKCSHLSCAQSQHKVRRQPTQIW